MDKVLMSIIVNCWLHTLVCVGVWLQETGLDSHLRFYCLYCNLLTENVIEIQRGTAALQSTKNKIEN